MKNKEEFKKFLDLTEEQRFIYLTGMKLTWLQKLQIKIVNKWWTLMRKSFSDMNSYVLWESLYKGRF